MTGFFTRADLKKTPAKRSSSGKGHGRRSRAELIDVAALRKAGCSSCSLAKVPCDHPKMRASGSERPWVYFLGEAPGADEDEEGRQFVGRSGTLLRASIPESWVKKVRFNNCIRCHPPGNKTPSLSDVECCRNGVLADIEKTKPTVVVGVGGVALNWALGGSESIKQWRGRLMPLKFGSHECWFYPIVHPAFVLRGGGGSSSGYEREDPDDWKRVFKRDLGDLFGRLKGHLDAAEVADPKELARGTTLVYPKADGACDAVIDFLREAEREEVAAIDLETSTLRPYSTGAKILSVSIATRFGTMAFLLDHPEQPWSSADRRTVGEALRRFLESDCIKVAHHLSFELEWFYHLFGILRGNWGDTMLLAYVLDERRGGLDLDDVSLEHLGFRVKAVHEVDRGDLLSLDLGKLLQYNALDAAVTLPLWNRLADLVDEQGLWDVYLRQLRRIPTLVAAQARGLSVDFDEVERINSKLTAEVKQTKQAIARMPEVADYQKDHGEFNPESPAQVAVMFRDVLQKRAGLRRRGDVESYSTDKSVLATIGGPLANGILRLRSLVKLCSTYSEEYNPQGRYIHPDGRIHTSFNTTFTVTGRLSSDSPNMQNFPKRKDAWVRSMIVPSPGNILLSADYGQIEARVIAMMSHDERLVDALWTGFDIHLYWAEWVAKRCPSIFRDYDKDIKKLRSDIKNKLVFPAFYGSQESSIVADLHLPLSVGREFFEEFWETHKGVKQWQNRLLAEYQKQGYIECLTGRRRRAPMTSNMVLNAGVQGTASDIVVEAGDNLSEQAEREDRPELQFVLNIHDDLMFDVPKKKVDVAQESIVKAMLGVHYDWMNVPITIEVSRGDNWYGMKEVGKFSSHKGRAA